jgi:hypothetical protein
MYYEPQRPEREGAEMNSTLMICGIALVCFADREMGTLETERVKVSVRYPLFGSLMFIVGCVIP